MTSSAPLSTPAATAEEAVAADAVSDGQPAENSAPLIEIAPGLALATAGAADARPPASPELAALHVASQAAYAAGRYADAIDPLRRILNFTPDSAISHGNLGVALWQSHRSPDAELYCRRAIALAPDYVAPHMLLAEILRTGRDAAGALACYSRIAALDPSAAMPHNNAGLVLKDLARFAEAEAAFARAEALRPGDLKIRFNRLMMRRDDTALAEAIDCCRQTLQREPGNAEVLTNLGVTLMQSGEWAEALASFRKAISHDPNNHGTRANLALLLLLLGDFEQGLHEYEARWQLLQLQRPDYARPEWQGEPLEGKTILLQQEQGLGDTIQSLRYVPLVAARGGRVVLRVERALLRVAASLKGNVIVSPPDAKLPEFDVWCPMLSLPRLFGTRADTIPAAVPYLAPRAAVAERWRRRLEPLPGLKIGLAWAGNPIHVNDFRRSIGLDRLAPLLRTPGISWVSLQVGPRAGELSALPAGTVTEFSGDLHDMTETAGAILNLDLVIAVDTAVAHLTGALARPGWVLLPFLPDWRWQLDREDSPWYPTLRLFRQGAPGDWDGVIRRVGEALTARLGDQNGPRTAPGHQLF